MIDMKPACRQMTDLLAAVSDDQLANPTPCTEYDLGDLIEHIDEVARGFTGIARNDGGEQATAVRRPDLADGPRADVAKRVQVLGESWDDPDAWRGSTEGPGVELPNELWGKIALTELVVHGWDIAQSIGRDIDLPDDTLKACLDHVAEFVPNAPIPELWGDAVEAPPGAARLDRILAISGRNPFR
ncbi:TIGR03086 family protein [Actinomadura sp. 7K507]|nr:TIGR03086 family protein [Actinomadura sp. 7K507]